MLLAAILEPWRCEALRNQWRRSAKPVKHIEGGRVKRRRAGFLAQVRARLKHGHRYALTHQIRRCHQADRPGSRNQHAIIRSHERDRRVCSGACELSRALGMKSFHAFAEIIGLPQTAVAVPFQFDRGREGGILGIIQEFLCGALRKR